MADGDETEKSAGRKNWQGAVSLRRRGVRTAATVLPLALALAPTATNAHPIPEQGDPVGIVQVAGSDYTWQEFIQKIRATYTNDEIFAQRSACAYGTAQKNYDQARALTASAVNPPSPPNETCLAVLELSAENGTLPSLYETLLKSSSPPSSSPASAPSPDSVRSFVQSIVTAALSRKALPPYLAADAGFTLAVMNHMLPGDVDTPWATGVKERSGGFSPEKLVETFSKALKGEAGAGEAATAGMALGAQYNQKIQAAQNHTADGPRYSYSKR